MTSTAELLLSPASAERLLRPWLRRAYPAATSVRVRTSTDLHSVQAGRGVFRLSVAVQGANPRVLELFANFDRRGQSRDIYRLLAHLYRHGFRRGRLRVPTPLGYLPSRHLLVYQAYAGRRVRDELERRRLSVPTLERDVRDAARWLRKLHALPPRVGRSRNLNLDLARYRAAPVAQRRSLAAAVATINRSLVRAGRLGPRRIVHGDPHLANCIRGRDGGFALIDYSESYLGHPLADVGMFLVHLDLALQPYFPRRVVGQVQRQFLATYLAGRQRDKETIRTLSLYMARAAAAFLAFSTDHHRRPRGYMRWVINQLITLTVRGADQASAPNPQIPLAD